MKETVSFVSGVFVGALVYMGASTTHVPAWTADTTKTLIIALCFFVPVMSIILGVLVYHMRKLDWLRGRV